MKRSPLTVFLVVLLVASCTSHKKIVKPEDHSDYQWMTAKMNVEVSTVDTTLNSQLSTLNFAGTVRMRRDSVVWVSVSAMLGMETIRVLVSQDSVVVINRMSRNYLAEPSSKVEERFRIPVTPKELQGMLLGNGISDHVEIQYGPYQAKIKYSDIHWDEPTTFPIKTNNNYERIKL